jgi:phenylpropionate dioxygenase-like ring-hydroxylating dioxygenase large terminal subunit
MGNFLYDLWYVAGVSKDFPAGKTQELRMLGEPIAVGRTRQGRVFALRDICPHRSVPFSAGWQFEEPDGSVSVQCPYHGWRFATSDGKCAAIPALPSDSDIDVSTVRVRAFPVREQEGLIWVYISRHKQFRGEPLTEPPLLGAPSSGKVQVRIEKRFFCHVDEAVLGLIDPAHGPYVHRQWWWRTSGSEHDKQKDYTPSELGFTMVAHKPSSNSYAYKIIGGTPQTEIEFRLPGIRVERIENAKNRIFNATFCTPVTEDETRVINVLYWSSPVMSVAKPLVLFLGHTFLGQDAGVVNLQHDRKKLHPASVLMGDADELAKWYRRLCKEWTDAKEDGRPFVNPVKAQTLRWRS